MRFLEVILGINTGRLWLFDLFPDGGTFFKYLELIVDNISPFEMLVQLAAEFEGTEIAEAIKDDIVTYDFDQENNNLILYLFDVVLSLNTMSPEMQDSVLKGLRDNNTIDNNRPANITDIKADIEESIFSIKNFYSILQGSAVNMLSTVRTKNLSEKVLDIKGNASIRDERFELIIKDYNTLKNGIPEYVHQFFDCLLWQFTLTGAKSAQIRLPLDVYMNMRGLNNAKEARKSVLDSIGVLKQLEYNVYESIKGKSPRWSGYISVYGGTGFIKNSIIHFNFNQDFYKTLSSYTPMEVPKEGLRIDTHKNPNSFHFLKYISLNYRLNEGKRRQDVISIATLISKSPPLPTYDEVMNGDRALNRRIIHPTFRDLDALNAINYVVLGPDGTEIDNPYNMRYQDFITSKIQIDYSRFPAHKERLDNRRQHLEAARKRKHKKTATAKI